MNLSDLVKKDRIKEIPIDEVQIKNSLELCHRDLKAAEFNLKNDLIDWAFSISYNSILQAGRALMYAYGYTPRSDDSHRITLEFIEIMLGSKHSELFNTLDRIRKKRHITVYDQTGVVTAYEAKFAFNQAKEFVKIVEKKIKEKKLF
ncbi:HEPN domain-containing protein [Candidatus Micrarchaeota archaeon]|nr:HEPN domain-containing protein [Candidatus Micrarchaeota archaeon]